MGDPALADRLEYLASDNDLEPGESPVLSDSAEGFLKFHSVVKSEGGVGLACSPEGWVCAEWRFPDQRNVSLWFLDVDRVMFSATNKKGEFVRIEGNSKSLIALRLHPDWCRRSYLFGVLARIMWPGIVARAASRMEGPQRMLFYYETASHFYRRIG